MNTFQTLAGLSVVLLALSACDRKSTDSAPATPSASTAPAAASSTAMPDSVPGSGPAEGGTAIGGPSSNQDTNGASRSDAPASTGGDGSSPVPQK